MRLSPSRFPWPRTRLVGSWSKALACPLGTLVSAFKRGESPESIQESCPTVAPADVYAVLAYYLNHRAEVEVYIAEQERAGAEI